MPHRDVILVCIGSHPKSHALLRAAANKSRETRHPWRVLYVDIPGASSESRQKQHEFFDLARRLGGEVDHIEAKSVVDGIIRYIDGFQPGQNVKYLIVGHLHREGFFEEFRRSIAERLAPKLRKRRVEMQLVPLTGEEYTTSWFDRFARFEVSMRGIVFSLVGVLVAYGVTEFIHMQVDKSTWRISDYNVMALFLIATVISSLRYGIFPGLISALVGFSTINYFYLAPIKTLGIANPAEAIGLTVFLVSAVIVALMGAYARSTERFLQIKERRVKALYEVYRIASDADNRDDALRLFHEKLTDLLDMEVAFFFPQAADAEPELVCPKKAELSPRDQAALLRCWSSMATAGVGTAYTSHARWRFEPLLTTSDVFGVMGVKVLDNISLDPSFGRLLTAIADQVAAILERIELTQQMSESRVREERDKLRVMLLSSVSHDLKTPLASVIGSLSVYQRMDKAGRLQPDIAGELVETALDEAQRLDSFISNILDMTKLESGNVNFHQDWVEPREIVESVRKRLRNRLRDRALIVDDNSRCEVYMDRVLTEQVLQNVVDNAAKYSTKGTDIVVTLNQTSAGFDIQIRDFGHGIPEDKLDAIFDKYERLKHQDSQIAGTGLGLAISKAIMQKQGGDIRAGNHPEGGALFTLTFTTIKELPVAPAQEVS